MSAGKTLALFVLVTLCSDCLAQSFTINGYVRDAASGESLIAASVYDRKTSSGTSTNTFGFYSLTLRQNAVDLTFSYVGYQPATISFSLTKDTVINVALTPQVLDEVVVSSGRTDEVEVTQMSSVDIPVQTIKELPALLGEVDVLKVLQLLPGVQSGNEGGSGIYVRGGGPDQNLILLDGVPVYNVSHLFGFFSVFNADAINHVELVKGGFPARYGGRLSSVIDVSMKDGNMNKVKGEGSIGLIAAKISVEGPIKKDKASFIVSARRTYIDLITRPLIKKETDGDEVFGYFFYDFNTKFNYKINSRNRIFLSTYTGDDKAYARSEWDEYDAIDQEQWKSKSEFGLRWGNIITALRWNYVVNEQLFSNVTATYSRYRFKIFNDEKESYTSPTESRSSHYSNAYISGIRDWAMKIDFDFLPSPDHFIRFGANAIAHRFTPGVFNYRSNIENDTTLGSSPVTAGEFSLYVEDDYKISERLKVNAGLHASMFVVDDKTYSSVQPRFSARYLLNDNWSLKASYTRMTQFIHLLTNAGLGLPTDLWVPATRRVAPQRADQVALGIVMSPRSEYEITLEGYYKGMHDLIEYAEGSSFINLSSDWQDKVVTGEGRSYGAELLLRKKLGPVTGWVGYTLSWSDRTFPAINYGKRFPYKYDRRHDVSVVLSHQWSKKKDFSLTWVYGTGNAVSLPTATYPEYTGNGWVSGEIEFYDGRNNFRMSHYHRLDLSVSFWKTTKWGERKWTISIYNAYNRKNPFFMDIGYDDNGDKQVVEHTLFPIIPSVTYSFKF
jgi:hypothetical protein